MAVAGGEQHRESIGIETLRDASRRSKAHPIDQRLQLDEQRPPALARHGDDAAWRRLARAREEDGGRVLHLAQAARGHGEEAELVHGAEAVLGGAHDAVAAAGLVLEVQHRVHQVLEQAGTCDRAFLGDVADDDDGGAARLGEAHQLRGAFAQLRHGARRRTSRGRLHGLYGIDHQQFGAPLAGEREDGREVGLGHHRDARRAE